jgi:hypothetical protein
MTFPSLSWCRDFKLHDDCLLSHTSELITSTTVTAQSVKKGETWVIFLQNTELPEGDLLMNILKKSTVRTLNITV